MAVQIQMRRGNAADWSTTNPILAEGEIGLELDTQKFKMGTGLLAWNSLGYYTAGASTVDSVNGQTGVVVLDTDDVSEGTTNKYYTDTRARAAISAGIGISYNSTTGVISSTITQYSDAAARAAVSATGSLNYNSTTGVFSYTTPNSDGITEGTTNKYYTDARARSAVSATGSLSYNSTTGVFSYTQPTNVSTFTNDANYLANSAIGVTVQGYNANTVIDSTYVHTDNNYTTTEKNKLAGIADGAEVNVNADWNAVSGDAQILNKPTIPSAITISDEGTTLTSTPTSINFVGSGVTSTTVGNNVTVTIPGSTATTAVAVLDEGTTVVSATGSINFTGAGVTASGILTAATVNIPGMIYPNAGIPVSTGTAWGTSYSTTGSGNVVLDTSPTLVTPILGTPQSGNFSTGTFTWPTFNQNTTGTASNITGTVAITNGGTGLTSTPANGELDIGNGSGFTRTTLIAGTNVTITNGPGSITIAAASGGGSMVYPGAGIPVSTGTAWGTSKTTPTGDIVGTTDTQTLTNKTFTGFTETIFSVSGTTPALSPTNGTIQTWTLTGNSTPTAGTWANGQSITLMVNDGTAFTITWTSLAVTWVGGTAPVLATTGFTVIELWEVGSVIYGALVGNVA